MNKHTYIHKNTSINENRLGFSTLSTLMVHDDDDNDDYDQSRPGT